LNKKPRSEGVIIYGWLSQPNLERQI